MNPSEVSATISRSHSTVSGTWLSSAARRLWFTLIISFSDWDQKAGRQHGFVLRDQGARDLPEALLDVVCGGRGFLDEILVDARPHEFDPRRDIGAQEFGSLVPHLRRKQLDPQIDRMDRVRLLLDQRL